MILTFLLKMLYSGVHMLKFWKPHGETLKNRLSWSPVLMKGSWACSWSPREHAHVRVKLSRARPLYGIMRPGDICLGDMCPWSWLCSNLDFQLSWKSGKFQLAIMSSAFILTLSPKWYLFSSLKMKEGMGPGHMLLLLHYYRLDLDNIFRSLAKNSAEIHKIDGDFGILKKKEK